MKRLFVVLLLLPSQADLVRDRRRERRQPALVGGAISRYDVSNPAAPAWQRKLAPTPIGAIHIHFGASINRPPSPPF